MPCHKSTVDAPILQFTNCRILKEHVLQREDLWVRAGKILNPEKVFFDEKKSADVQLDCKGSILAPGFIDVQINGGFGVDFSLATDEAQAGISLVGQRILSNGVTSFCPTMVTSPSSVYHKVLPQIRVQNGGPHGAGILGIHLEGPFISKEKKGAHPENCLRTFESGGFQDFLAMYGSLDCVRIVTLAPEMKRSDEVIQELTKRGICVSLVPPSRPRDCGTSHKRQDSSRPASVLRHDLRWDPYESCRSENRTPGPSSRSDPGDRCYPSNGTSPWQTHSGPAGGRGRRCKCLHCRDQNTEWKHFHHGHLYPTFQTCHRLFVRSSLGGCLSPSCSALKNRGSKGDLGLRYRRRFCAAG